MATRCLRPQATDWPHVEHWHYSWVAAWARHGFPVRPCVEGDHRCGFHAPRWVVETFDAVHAYFHTTANRAIHTMCEARHDLGLAALEGMVALGGPMAAARTIADMRLHAGRGWPGSHPFDDPDIDCPCSRGAR